MKIISRKSLPDLLGVSDQRVRQLLKELAITVGIAETDLKRLQNRNTEPTGRPKKGAKK